MSKDSMRQISTKDYERLFTTLEDWAQALRHIEQVGHAKTVGKCGDIAEKALEKHPGWEDK
jgi:hypothetical protein